MDSLKETLCRVMAGYAGKGFNGISYLTWNETQDVFATVSVAVWKGERIADCGLLVRLLDGLIVIEGDMNDKPLVDALQFLGPSEKTSIVISDRKSHSSPLSARLARRPAEPPCRVFLSAPSGDPSRRTLRLRE